MGKEIVIEELNYLTGDLMDVSGHTEAISCISIQPIETTNSIINNFDELLEHFENTPAETDKFTAYIFTKSGDIYKLDTYNDRKVIMLLTGASIFKELEEVKKGYDNILKYIAYKSRQSSLLDLTVTEDFYNTLYRLYYANEQGFLSHYIDWNKEIYTAQINMLHNQSYPLKVTEIFPKELCTLETDLERITKHWKALTQANLSLASAVETMANNMAWLVSNNKDMSISQYIYQISKDSDIYRNLARDYNSLVGKMRDDERLRTLFGA